MFTVYVTPTHGIGAYGYHGSTEGVEGVLEGSGSRDESEAVGVVHATRLHWRQFVPVDRRVAFVRRRITDREGSEESVRTSLVRRTTENKILISSYFDAFSGVNSLVFEIRFPPEFPHSPPFFRILKPRFLPFIQVCVISVAFLWSVLTNGRRVEVVMLPEVKLCFPCFRTIRLTVERRRINVYGSVNGGWWVTQSMILIALLICFVLFRLAAKLQVRKCPNAESCFCSDSLP